MNPFLVIGGVAVTVATAAIGILAVPGWIDSANDSAVRNDLSQIAIAQEAAYTVAANYVPLTDLTEGVARDHAGASLDSGVEVQLSDGVTFAVGLNAEKDEWAAVGVSKSGHVFVRTSESAKTFTDDSKTFTEAMTSINGDLTSVGARIGGTATAPTITITG